MPWLSDCFKLIPGALRALASRLGQTASRHPSKAAEHDAGGGSVGVVALSRKQPTVIIQVTTETESLGD